MAALRNLVMDLLRLGGVKNISAALRHYGWKPWETLPLIAWCEIGEVTKPASQ